MPKQYQDRDYVGVRLGPELRARAAYAAQQSNMPLSAWMRAAVEMALNYGLGGNVEPYNQGFVAGRAFGMQIAQTLIYQAVREAVDQTPMSFEEAQARFPNGEGVVLTPYGHGLNRPY